MEFLYRLYYEEFGWRPKLDGITFTSVDEWSQELLEREFIEKILEGLLQCREDKAYGLDGFNEFFQHVIKETFLCFLRSFMNFLLLLDL